MTKSAITIAILCIILSSCADRIKERKLVICSVDLIDGASTSEQANFFAGSYGSLLFTSPLYYDSDSTLHNILIDETTHTADWKTWNLTIKKGVTFSDGRPLTAADLESSIKKEMETSGKYKSLTELTVTGESSLSLRFDAPAYDIFDFIDVSIFPSHIVTNEELWRKTILKNPIGSGPFIFGRWLDGGMEFKANERYFEGRPTLDKISVFYEPDENKRLIRLLKGEADIIAPVSPKTAIFLEKDAKFYVNKAISPFYAAVFFNNNSPFFKNSKVRMAVKLAVSKELLIEKSLNGGGVPATGPFLKQMLPDGYRSPDHGYDPGRAVRLLNGTAKKQLRFTLLYNNAWDEMSKVADVIAQQLFEVGIEVRCISVTNSEFRKKQFLSGEYDAILSIANAFSPEEKWMSNPPQGNNYNFSNYSNKDVDKLIDQAQTADEKARKSIYAEIDRIISEDAPALFLYNPVYFTAATRKFKGAEEFKGDPYSWYKIKDWTLKKEQ